MKKIKELNYYKKQKTIDRMVINMSKHRQLSELPERVRLIRLAYSCSLVGLHETREILMGSLWDKNNK